MEGGEPMGETAILLRSMQRLLRLVEEQVEDLAKADDETDAAERRALEKSQNVKNSKLKGKQVEGNEVTRESMGSDAVDVALLELKLLKLNNNCNENLRSSGIVLNTMLQEFVTIMERFLAHVDNVASASSRNLKSTTKQRNMSTTLSEKDTAFLAEFIQIIQNGGNWKELNKEHMKAYLRHHGLRLSGRKDILKDRIEWHLKTKDVQGQDIHPRLSFSIKCKGNACCGDTVLFLQTVRDFASCPRLGERWVAGKVLRESYGGRMQQHTFTIEVLWSTGTKPLCVMHQLLIKGRNLYHMDTLRQPWSDEEYRKEVLAEKYTRRKQAIANAREKTRAERNQNLVSSKGGSKSEPSSNAPSETQHHASSSCSMPTQDFV